MTEQDIVKKERKRKRLKDRKRNEKENRKAPKGGKNRE